MKIEAIPGSDMTFEEWGNRRGLELVAVERSLAHAIGGTPGGNARMRWYAHFKDVEVMVGSAGLLGEHGNGPTPEAAAKDYERLLRGKRIVVSAMSPDRREIQCPNEWRPASA